MWKALCPQESLPGLCWYIPLFLSRSSKYKHRSEERECVNYSVVNTACYQHQKWGGEEVCPPPSGQFGRLRMIVGEMMWCNNLFTTLLWPVLTIGHVAIVISIQLARNARKSSLERKTGNKRRWREVLLMFTSPCHFPMTRASRTIFLPRWQSRDLTTILETSIINRHYRQTGRHYICHNFVF